MKPPMPALHATLKKAAGTATIVWRKRTAIAFNGDCGMIWGSGPSFCHSYSVLNPKELHVPHEALLLIPLLQLSTENQYSRHPLFLGQFGELFMKPVGGMMVCLGRPGVFRLVFKGKGRFVRALGSAFSCKILGGIDDDMIELCGK